MATAIERRRSRFLEALAAAKQTQSGWAKENGVSKGHLSLVLSGDRDSDALWLKIDAFSAAHLSKTKALAS